jgi:NADPH:quinone reductase-like Zn-dependent oxidoreductase
MAEVHTVPSHLMTKIRAIRIYSFCDGLQVDDVEPSFPDTSQVLLRVKAASINLVDFTVRNGKPATNPSRRWDQ